MKFCMPHWDRLQKAIEEKGMKHLIHASAEAAHESVIRQLEGHEDKTDFDPLLNATWAIYGQFIQNVGLAAMVGDICPLCDVDARGPSSSQNWIDGSTADQLKHARHLGLIPEVQ
jgi:hypothetical protein